MMSRFILTAPNEVVGKSLMKSNSDVDGHYGARGNFTGQELKIKGHFDYEWKDGKIVRFFADEQFNKICSQASSE